MSVSKLVCFYDPRHQMSFSIFYSSLPLLVNQEHFLFDKPVSPLLTAAGMARDWPDARGIW